MDQTPPHHRTLSQPWDGAESPDPQESLAALPDGLVDWIQPWRAPEECLVGGLALARSAEVLLKNVEAARQASMRQLYGLREGQSTVGSLTPRTNRDAGSVRSSLAMKSVSAQRRSRVGMTLLDLVSCPSSRRSSIFLPDATTPLMSGQLGSSFPRPQTSTTPHSKVVSSRWSAAGDRDEHGTPHTDSVRLSAGSVPNLTDASGRTPEAHILDRNGHGDDDDDDDPHPLRLSASPPPQQAPNEHVRHATTNAAPPVPVIPRFDQFMQDKETLLKVLAADPLPPPRRGNSPQATSPSPPAPAPLAMLLGRRGKDDGDGEEDDDDEEEEDGMDGVEGSMSPPHPSGAMRTARPGRRSSAALSDLAHHEDDALALPHLNRDVTDHSPDERSLAVVDGTGEVEDSWLARPRQANAHEANGDEKDLHEEDVLELSYSIEKEDDNGDGTGHDGDDHDEDDDDDAPEFDEELNASEHNFGEGGHLACVPGDTLHNRYVLLKQLGVGRSSRVWMAVDLEQGSVARRQLIRAVGESLVRELSNPKDKPLFVAIKVFRCGEVYSACARYEVKLLNYINERVKVQSVQRHFMLGGGRSRNASVMASPARVRSLASGGGASPSSIASSASAGPLPFDGSSLSAPSTAAPTATAAAAQILSDRIHVACAKANFTVEGDYGTHHCIVMDVLGTGVDAAINETNLRGVPLPIARSILISSLQGLATLASMSVIHTDLKPENLLFVDLDAKTAEEMETFQASHFGASLRGGLWTGFTHRRLAIAEYVAAVAAAHQSTTTTTNTNTNTSDADTHVSPKETGKGTGKGQQKAARSPADVGRVLFKVQVADLGLSFVVPPALRSGVAQLMDLGGPDVVAQTPAAQMQIIRDFCAAANPEDDPGLASTTRSGLDSVNNATSPASVVRVPTAVELVTNESLNPIHSPPGLTASGTTTSLVRAQNSTSSYSALASSPGKTAPVHTERVSVFQLPNEPHDGTSRGGSLSRRSRSSAAAALTPDDPRDADEAPFLASISSLESATDLPQRGSVGGVGAATGDRRFTHRDVTASYDRSGLSSVLVSRVDNNDGDGVAPAAQLGAGQEHAEPDVEVGDGAFVPIAVAAHGTMETATYHSPPPQVALPVAASTSTAEAQPARPQPGSERRRRTSRKTDPSADVARNAPRLSALYSCIVAPPTELEMDILQHQNYSRGAVVQSREYRSPEIVLGDFFLPSCDVWSFGCIAYELVVGRFLMDPTLDYNDMMNNLIEMERERRRDEVRRERRNRHRRGAGGSVDGGSSHASLSISGRVSKWLGFRSGAGAGGGANSDLADSFGRRSSGGKLASPQQPPQSKGPVVIPSHSNSEEDEEVTAAGHNLRWLDGIEDHKSVGSRGSPAVAVPPMATDKGYDSVVRAERGGSGSKEGTNEIPSDSDEEPDDASVVLNSEEEEEVVMAVQGVYFDDYEKDVDVFHLKSMMRLVGPPPLGYLQRDPEGLFVRDFFDDKGQFLFYDDQAVEETEYAIDQIRVLQNRERELLSRGGSGQSPSPVRDGESPPVTYDSLFHPSGESHGSVTPHASALMNSPPVLPAAAAAAAVPGGLATSHTPESVDLLCELARRASDSATPSVLSIQLGTSLGSTTADAAAAATSAQASFTLLSTSNYPVTTPTWRQLQREIREKMPDEAEAVEFERLLWRCLQWDPAMRADANTLLQSRWFTAFGDLATEP